MSKETMKTLKTELTDSEKEILARVDDNKEAALAALKKETSDNVARIAIQVKKFFDAWKSGLNGRLSIAFTTGRSKDGSMLTLIASKKGDMSKLSAESIIPFFVDIIDDSDDIMRTTDQIELNQADSIIFKVIGGPDLVTSAVNHFSLLPKDQRALLENGIVSTLSLGYQLKGQSKKMANAKALKFLFSCATSGTVMLPVIAKAFGMSRSDMVSASSFFADAIGAEDISFEGKTPEEKNILDSIDDIKKGNKEKEDKSWLKIPFSKRNNPSVNKVKQEFEDKSNMGTNPYKF